VKVETTETGPSPTFRGIGPRRSRVSNAEHRCTCASSYGDALTDGRGIECVQWRGRRFIEVIAGVVASFTSKPVRPHDLTGLGTSRWREPP